MKLFNLSIVGLVAAASGVFAQNVDWSSSDTLTCGLEYYSDIKAAVDGNIQPVWDFLPTTVKSKAEEAGIVNPNHSLITNPTAEQLQTMATIFPSGLFSPYADNIVRQCLATFVPTDTQPTDSETSGETSDVDTSEETSDVVTSDEDTTTDEVTTGEESTDKETSDSETSEDSSDEDSSSEETSNEESSSEESSDGETTEQDTTNEDTTEQDTTGDYTSNETEEPTSSEPDYSAEPTSTPIKCRPRY